MISSCIRLNLLIKNYETKRHDFEYYYTKRHDFEYHSIKRHD